MVKIKQEKQGVNLEEYHNSLPPCQKLVTLVLPGKNLTTSPGSKEPETNPGSKEPETILKFTLLMR